MTSFDDENGLCLPRKCFPFLFLSLSRVLSLPAFFSLSLFSFLLLLTFAIVLLVTLAFYSSYTHSSCYFSLVLHSLVLFHFLPLPLLFFPSSLHPFAPHSRPIPFYPFDPFSLKHDFSFFLPPYLSPLFPYLFSYLLSLFPFPFIPLSPLPTPFLDFN